MSLGRRDLVRALPFALAAPAAFALVVSSVGPAVGAPGSHAARSQRKVCAAQPAGVAACHAHIVTNAATGQPLASRTWQEGDGYSPAELAEAYPPAGNEAPLVAVVDAYAHPHAATDLAAYRATFGLGDAELEQVNQNRGSIASVPANVDWGREEMLDLEMVSALCPACHLLYVGATSASLTDLAAAVTTAHNKGAVVISNSYGASEFSRETQFIQWNIPGAVVTASSGDSGYGVSFPAASADVVAVGGTTLTLAGGGRATETAWSGSGSGCSAYVAKPSWQHDLGCPRRTVTDVAAVADPYTGVAVYDSYGSTDGNNWYVFGGTSVAAPLVAAVFARSGVPTAPAAKALYDKASQLFDVTAGSNGKCAPPTGKRAPIAYLCTAGEGYDGPTGNGTPNGSAAPF